jgi:sugar/nucleoside kinase (ribokinase family)
VARKAVPPPVKQVYKPKQREEVQKMEVDPERTTSQDIIQIGSMGVLIGEDGKRPIVTNNKVVTSTPEVAANDHEASGSSSNSKYFLPRWCPSGLTRTQRRKLQRLRF